MHSASHRLNHDFQLQHFLAGLCHTPDGAYALMYGQKIDMESKVKASETQKIEREIKQLECEAVLKSWFSSRIKKLTAKKELLELEASRSTWEMSVAGAKNELATIEKLMATLEPLRKYAHLSILDANEACQQEEWLGELKYVYRRVGD